MDARDEILKRIDERQDEWLQLLGDLVRCRGRSCDEKASINVR